MCSVAPALVSPTTYELSHRKHSMLPKMGCKRPRFKIRSITAVSALNRSLWCILKAVIHISGGLLLMSHSLLSFSANTCNMLYISVLDIAYFQSISPSSSSHPQEH